AVAQRATDLDKATKDQLTRGERMVEILKQTDLHPLPLERQVVSIFAGNEGFLDDIPASKVQMFEKDLLAFIDRNYQEIFMEIAEKKIISDALKENLKQAILKFKQTFEKPDKG
ncbi:MAG: F0F1 ATP synthase subunit alpha, partial [Candidatus Omnitrophica bacterium]|nr:F0F1 ATP synthase subunit alpha [Candidatus Omnitrophota bacterium]